VYLARYYDSRTGTFCSADLLAGDPGDPQSWNRYPYGRNDPIDITDPSGKSWAKFFEDLGLGLLLGPAAPFVALQVSLETGEPPWDLNPAGGFGGAAMGASWNGTPINMSNPGIAGALGLPTMADVGGPINNLAPAPNSGCPPNQQRFFANYPLYLGIAKKANTDVNFIMAISAQESGWNGPHSQELHNLVGTTHAGGKDLSYSGPGYAASANAWATSYSSWVNGATNIKDFTNDLLNHKPPYNVNRYGDYYTAIVGGTFSKEGPFKGAKTIGTYQSVLNYAGPCGVAK
jgi:hypothetical protein